MASLLNPAVLKSLFFASVGLTGYLALKPKGVEYARKLPAPTATSGVNRSVLGLSLDDGEFVSLLREMIGHTRDLQNNAPMGIFPKEDLIVAIVEKYLAPFSSANGGPLVLKRCSYVEGRSNLVITYPGTTDRYMSFVGAHMDVVPANAAEWDRDPFSLTVDGDKLYGRGVTDCLGHVALLTQMLKQLAVAKPVLKTGVAVVFIANEENSSVLGVGIDEMEKRGELKFLKNAPLFWIDSADIGPTLGTGGVWTWQLTANGKSMHSAFPHKGINAVSLAYESVKYIQKRFYKDFPYSERDQEYKYVVGSSLKPTQVAFPEGTGITIIPPKCTIKGDCRLLPTYSMAHLEAKLNDYVNDLNEKIIPNNKLPLVGYDSYVLPTGADGSAIKGLVTWEWTGHATPGVAVNLSSVGYKAISDATFDVFGSVTPFSVSGTLPIIADLQAAGYDVQITGFGNMATYHAANEYGKLSDFSKGARVLFSVIANLDHHLSNAAN